MRLSFAFLLVVVWFAGCGSGPSASCESTSDCRSGRMCIDGRCELVPDTAFVDAPGTETDGGGSETDGGELFDGGLPVEGGGSASAPDADGDAISDAQEGRATRPRAGQRLDFGGRTIDELEAGNGFACIRSDGSVYCVGDNVSGQLGDGTTRSRRSAVLVGIMP